MICLMSPTNCKLKLVLCSLSATIFLMAGLELILRMAGFEFHAPAFIPPSPSCMVLRSCNNDSRGLFEKKGSLLSVRKEYSGWFQAQDFPEKKPKDEFRVFILGGSVIYNLYGEMASSYSDAGGMRVRIINIGGNSFGTTRLLPLFNEITGYDPDMVIVYSGHNEFVDIVITNSIIREILPRQEMREILRRSRVSELVEMAVYKTGMSLMGTRKRHTNEVVRFFSSMLPPGTDKNKIYGVYRENIISMVQKARARNILLRLSTVAYNRALPPVRPDGARIMHKNAMELVRGGKYKEAFTMLDKALDEEEIPVSANETSNGIIRDIAGKYKMPLLDVDAAVVARAPGGIPGNETFLDHCHFIDGRFLGELFQKEIHSAIVKRKKIKPLRKLPSRA